MIATVNHINNNRLLFHSYSFTILTQAKSIQVVALYLK